MMRPFAGAQTVAGAAAQPVFGTALTAAAKFSIDPYTGTNRPGTTTPPVILNVTSTAGLKQNDRIMVGPTANFTSANRKLLDQGTIAAVISATQISVVGLLQNHAATGEWVVLNEVASIINVFPLNVANAIYLGADSTTSAADASVFAGGSPQYWVPSFTTTGTGQAYQTCEFWIAATTGDTFIASFSQM